MKRKDILPRLKTDESFDMLVIGGGATGCGVALDAASRGLNVALVEKNDFSEGTSSRSTAAFATSRWQSSTWTRDSTTSSGTP